MKVRTSVRVGPLCSKCAFHAHMQATSAPPVPTANADSANSALTDAARGWRGVLPHEWVFGAFLAVLAVRLTLRGGAAAGWSLIFWACLMGSGLVIGWTQRKPTRFRWYIRLLYYPAIMGISFYAMEPAVPLLGPKKDDLLLAWDRALLGETPAVMWESWGWPWLEDIAMAGYLFFFYYLVASPAWYAVKSLPRFRQCIVGLFTLYGLGFLGYTLLPAGGPHRYLEFNRPLEGIWLLPSTLKIVNDGSNCVDVFPSIHFAATLYLLGFDYAYHRSHFRWAWLPCLILWFSTMYLRFHYFVDLLGGLLIAIIGGWVSAAYGGSQLETALTRQTAAYETARGRSKA
ncbi:MAG: phosphatase PAP2 family protein [Verrucomicrobiota bacterium]|nr:phosphatase PAP2 family protein [Limisphaera sp.]MDW8381292.1 phosphatase PAP2 family protein [Verrucomicrobiota bacterium]